MGHDRVTIRFKSAPTYIVTHTHKKTGEGKSPEDGAERLRHAQLKVARCGFQMKTENDGDADDSHVYRQAEVGEEGCARQVSIDDAGGILGATNFAHLRNGRGHRSSRWERGVVQTKATSKRWMKS